MTVFSAYLAPGDSFAIFTPDNIKDILDNFEAIKELIDDWDSRVEDAAHRSSKGVPSPRYEKAMQLLEELRSLI